MTPPMIEPFGIEPIPPHPPTLGDRFVPVTPHLSELELEVDQRRRVLSGRKVGVTVRESLHYDRDLDDREPPLDDRDLDDREPPLDDRDLDDREPPLELVHRLEGYVLADHVANQTYTATTEHLWPATTWQMFKARHASSWWLRWLVDRRPVRLERQTATSAITVERFLTYPEAEISLPSLGSPRILEVVSAPSITSWERDVIERNTRHWPARDRQAEQPEPTS